MGKENFKEPFEATAGEKSESEEEIIKDLNLFRKI